ncbi:MAG TPA: alpha-ketoacid dehydrogenase subunit beta [Chloroflexi bacterium]|jgi:pyruvate dehydrogenase E1 component beta subunit|nr:alpha-ketoacid dehydrogenase subunit beta [Chloroflexota bacterium]
MTEERILTYWQALNEAIRMEMRRDNRVFVMGEDVAGAAGKESEGLVDAWGGPFGVTRGLIQEFGADRVRDTPISEAGFIGAAVGAAETGLRPWVDLMFTHFAGVAWDQISNKLAREHFYTNGQARLPVTIKTFGSCYSPFIHMPGLRCVAPSNPYNAKGLMIAAMRDDNPVIVFDNLALLRLRMHVPEEDYVIPIGQSDIARVGKDATLIGISAMTGVCLLAADRLAKDGIEVEVIDLLSLEPLDEATLISSVKRTKRVAIVDQDHPHCGMASYLAALLGQRVFDFLDAPIATITPPNAPEPMNHLLDAGYLPTVDRVVEAVRELLT